MQHYRLVLESYWSFSPTSEAFDWGFCFLWGLYEYRKPKCGHPFPPVFVMGAGENRVSHDHAVLGQGMSPVFLRR